MRYLLFLFLLTISAKAQINTMDCGYDFTSYLVLDVHERWEEREHKRPQDHRC